MPDSPLAPALHTAAEEIDRHAHTVLARLTGGLSPASLLLAQVDWAAHLAVAPGKQLLMARLAAEQLMRLTAYSVHAMLHNSHAPRCIEPPLKDRRFADPNWLHWPFNVLHQTFLLGEQWWLEATRGIRGVSKHHQDLVEFGTRQILDMVSPGNSPALNPVVLRRTLESGGANVGQGMLNWIDDTLRNISNGRPAGSEKYRVGHEVAVTPGKVVMRNRLVELIQYEPATKTVYPEPVLIVPAWIMKYYILDLSPHNSLIRYLVERGHTVFCISWKNPHSDDRDLGFNDYLDLGVRASLDAINTIVPERKVHAVGYCIGGTLLATGAAAMARDDDDRLATMTLFAAQTDFSEPGELQLFIDESQVSMLADQMEETGYLKAQQMGGAFQMLRSYDLLWSRMVNKYLLGIPEPMNDLMAWNADSTRMPARMHSQYLRYLFLGNDLAAGRYHVDGKPVVLANVRLPVFVVGTVTDHVAPWRSVYKIHLLTPAEITFVLTTGGHNAGIVSEPGHPRRSYQMLTRGAGDRYLPPDLWLEQAPRYQGSWWPAWSAWLVARSGKRVPPPPLGSVGKGYRVLGEAPGSFVLET